MLRQSLAVCGFFCAVLLANPAGALSVYGELLTSDAAFLLPDDIRSRVYLEDEELKPFGIDWGPGIVGTGLGSGRVPPTLTYTHDFLPGKNGAVLESADLSILVRDDFDLGFEMATVQLDGQFWAQGQATLNLFNGEVSAYLDDDAITVSISSDAIQGWFNRAYTGDFKVVSSLFVANYTSETSGAHAPEPGAALLFGVGALLVRRRLRRR